MTLILILTFLFQLAIAAATSSSSVLHFSLYRRGGQLSHHSPANITKLSSLLYDVESKYSRTYRAVQTNRLLRRWRPEQEDHVMLDQLGMEGIWYARIAIGNPPQMLEFDLDFHNPDFYMLLTTSISGSKFNTFASQSHVSSNTFVHPLCRLSSDDLHLSNSQSPIHLEWPVCQPSKSSRHTLSNSGTVLGLAPSPSSQKSSLSRLTTPSFVHLLHEKGITDSPIWSITLFDGATGVLSMGGSLAAEFEEAKTRAEAELKYLGQENMRALVEDEVRGKMMFAIPPGSTVDDHFKWTDVSGASGWWTGLMTGVWVDGIKILKNQPFIIDISCPFIIAPPSAFEHFYNSIGHSKPFSSMTVPNPFNTSNQDQSTNKTTKTKNNSNFHVFPCLNPPSISLELAGWPFPLLSTSHSTREDAIHGPAGGAFSLGKAMEVSQRNGDDDNDIGGTNAASDVNSGYCVGIVVQSDMGQREDKIWRESGMQDTWVLGEPFLRGLGVVFDDGSGNEGGKARMGFRNF